MNLRLRRAVAADLDALVALERRCFRRDRLERADFRRLLADPRARLTLAAGAGLCGYVLARLDARRALARVDSIAVAPAWRGRGLGRRLLAAAERGARHGGAKRLRLEVRARNRGARALYHAAGYRPLARLVDHYGAGADGVRYEKRLARGRGRAA